MKKLEKVKVYLNHLVPTHLAVRNEHNQVLRPICGTDAPGQQTVEADPTELTLQCESCQEQLDIWKRVKGDG